MAKQKFKGHKLMKSLPEYACLHASRFIAGYGIERAEIVAKLTLQKIRAKQAYMDKTYGGDIIKCKAHPLYQGKGKPDFACSVCWDIFALAHKNDKKEQHDP